MEDFHQTQNSAMIKAVNEKNHFAEEGKQYVYGFNL